MRYLVVTSNRELRRVFRIGLIYDEHHIAAELQKLGLRMTRPNGSSRTRGSRRLVVKAKNGTTLAVFHADIKEDIGPILPVPVGFI